MSKAQGKIPKRTASEEKSGAKKSLRRIFLYALACEAAIESKQEDSVYIKYGSFRLEENKKARALIENEKASNPLDFCLKSKQLLSKNIKSSFLMGVCVFSRRRTRSNINPPGICEMFKTRYFPSASDMPCGAWGIISYRTSKASISQPSEARLYRIRIANISPSLFLPILSV